MTKKSSKCLNLTTVLVINLLFQSKMSITILTDSSINPLIITALAYAGIRLHEPRPSLRRFHHGRQINSVMADHEQHWDVCTCVVWHAKRPAVQHLGQMKSVTSPDRAVIGRGHTCSLASRPIRRRREFTALWSLDLTQWPSSNTKISCGLIPALDARSSTIVIRKPCTLRREEAVSFL